MGCPSPSCASAGRDRPGRGVTDAAGSGDTAGPNDQCLEPTLVSRRPLCLFLVLYQRLKQHLAITPLFELVVEHELERSDGWTLEARRGVVEQVGVSADLRRE